MQRWKLSWVLKGRRDLAHEQRPGGGKPRTHAEQRATSQVRLKKRPWKGPGLPRAESHLYFAVSTEALKSSEVSRDLK